MKSSRDKIVDQVENVIAAVGALAGELNSAEDLEAGKKDLALTKLGEVAVHLKDLNTALFAAPLPTQESEPLTFFQDELASVQGAMPDPGEEPIESDEAQNSEEQPLALVVTPQASGEQDLEPEKEEPADEPDREQWAGRANNLQLIDGIDSAVEAKLNELGIYCFEQIAKFRRSDVEQISDALGVPYRAAHENWIEQATMLAVDVPTKYSSGFINLPLFDRLALNVAYDIEPEVSSADEVLDITGEAILAEPLSEPASEPEQEALQQSAEDPADIVKEKEQLEAELADLRRQLAEHKFMQENEVRPEESFVSSEMNGERAEPETDEAFEPPEADEEGDEAQVDHVEDPDLALHEFEDPSATEASHKLNGEADIGDGAIWHDEVSLGADYEPPEVDAFEDAASFVNHGEEVLPAEETEIDLDGPPAFLAEANNDADIDDEEAESLFSETGDWSAADAALDEKAADGFPQYEDYPEHLNEAYSPVATDTRQRQDEFVLRSLDAGVVGESHAAVPPLDSEQDLASDDEPDQYAGADAFAPPPLFAAPPPGRVPPGPVAEEQSLRFQDLPSHTDSLTGAHAGTLGDAPVDVFGAGGEAGGNAAQSVDDDEPMAMPDLPGPPPLGKEMKQEGLSAAHLEDARKRLAALDGAEAEHDGRIGYTPAELAVQGGTQNGHAPADAPVPGAGHLRPPHPDGGFPPPQPPAGFTRGLEGMPPVASPDGRQHPLQPRHLPPRPPMGLPPVHTQKGAPPPAGGMPPQHLAQQGGRPPFVPPPGSGHRPPNGLHPQGMNGRPPLRELPPHTDGQLPPNGRLGGDGLSPPPSALDGPGLSGLNGAGKNGDEAKKSSGVSAGFRLKARKFTESLQRSFVGKDSD